MADKSKAFSFPTNRPIKPGIYDGISNETYHAGPGISKSGLDLIEDSPATYKYYKDNPKPRTVPMMVSSALHDINLLPETFDSDFFVLPPDHSGSTKAGKALIDTLIKNHGLIAVPGQGISFKGEQQKGKKPVDLLRHDDFETMLAVQDAIENSQDPGAYALRHILKEGVSEQSLFWIDEETGLLCKCRPDHYNSTAGGVCLDLKFVKKGGAEIEQFKKDIVNYRYHVQAPWYRMGFMALGLPCERFVFGVVEKEPPYLIQCYNATPAMLEQGKMEAEQNLAQFAHCVKTDKWPGLDYGEPVVDIDLPGWYK